MHFTVASLLRVSSRGRGGRCHIRPLSQRVVELGRIDHRAANSLPFKHEYAKDVTGIRNLSMYDQHSTIREMRQICLAPPI